MAGFAKGNAEEARLQSVYSAPLPVIIGQREQPRFGPISTEELQVTQSPLLKFICLAWQPRLIRWHPLSSERLSPEPLLF